MTKIDVDNCLAALAVVYPQHFKAQSNPDLARQIYHRILRDIDPSLLEAATMQWLSTARPFHPSPGELRDMALTLIARDEKSADEAWLEVLQQMKSAGYYGVPTWSSERIARSVAALGNWKDFCITEIDKMSYARDSFMRIYSAQMKRQHDERLTLPETQQKLDAVKAMNGLTKRLSASR